MCKKRKWHKAAAVFVLNWGRKTGVGASTCVSQIYIFSSVCDMWHVTCHKFTCFKCLPPIFMCVAIGRDGHTNNMSCKCFSRLHQNIVLLCFARSCFLQQEISTFWPDSSKYLLCPLRDLFQVYITLYYPYPTLFWSNISPTSLLLWIEKKYWGVTFAQLVFIGIIFCSYFHLNLKVIPFAVPDLFCLMSGFEQDAQLWGPENTNKSYSANVSLETNRWPLDIQLFK